MVRLQGLAALGAALLLSSGSLLLTGCSTTAFSAAADAAQETTVLAGAHIHGKVHGGAYPIQGANIELWQSQVGTWNTAVGAYVPSYYNNTGTNSGFIASTTSASKGDGSGLSPGYFDFGNQTLSCTAGNFLYLTTTGGGTVSGKANSSVIQLGVIGQCPRAASQAAYFNNVNVFLSETSTVAAAYTLGNFISIDTDPTTNLQRVNITAPTNNASTGACTTSRTGTFTCTAAGLAHGFANAINLVDSVNFTGGNPTGAARATLPGNTLALAPQAMVNTLGNVLQSCVDSGPSSTSAPSSACNTLLGYAPSYNATAATNTLQVALNIARNPTYKVNGLYGLQSQNSPFSPMMSAAPTSFSLAIFYPPAAIGDSSFNSAADVALDAADNVYVAYSQSANGAVAELSAAGTSLFSGATPTLAGALNNPGTLAVDPSGHVWVTDTSASASAPGAGNAVGFNTTLTSSGSAVGTYYNTFTVPNGKASGIAFNSAGDAFLTRKATDNNINDYFYSSGNYTYTQAGTLSGANLIRAQVDIYGTFKAVGNKTFATFAPLPCATGYADSSVTLDTGGGMALAIDNNLYTGSNVSKSYTSFLPLAKELATANVQSNGNARCWTTTTSLNNSAGSASNDSNPNAAALDGAGNLFWSGSAGRLYSYLGATANEAGSGGTLGGTPTFFYPCNLAGATSCTYANGLAGMAVDSSGTLWYTATDASGLSYLVQHFGLAAPAWPLLAYAHSGLAF